MARRNGHDSSPLLHIAPFADWLVTRVLPYDCSEAYAAHVIGCTDRTVRRWCKRMPMFLGLYVIDNALVRIDEGTMLHDLYTQEDEIPRTHARAVKHMMATQFVTPRQAIEVITNEHKGQA